MEKEVKEALTIIIQNKHHKALNWCVEYAKSGLNMSGEMLRVQCLYILNNMQYWRGDVAKQVRSTLKQFVKVSK